MPMAPPSSRPRLRETMKYSPPTPTRMLVDRAEALRAVMQVMELASTTTSRVRGRPRLPSTQPKRRYMIRPRMVSTLGVYTPRKVPKVWGGRLAVSVMVRPRLG